MITADHIYWDNEALREFAKFISDKLDKHSFTSIPKDKEFEKLINEFGEKHPELIEL